LDRIPERLGENRAAEALGRRVLDATSAVRLGELWAGAAMQNPRRAVTLGGRAVGRRQKGPPLDRRPQETLVLYDTTRTVIIVRAGHRRDVYRGL